MALSNIFREPRRELTESLIGIALVGALPGSLYAFGCWISIPGKVTVGEGMLIGILCLVILGVIGAVLYGALLLTHDIGERLCNWAERHDVYLRPRVRR